MADRYNNFYGLKNSVCLVFLRLLFHSLSTTITTFLWQHFRWDGRSAWIGSCLERGVMCQYTGKSIITCFAYPLPFFPFPHARHLFKYVAKIETFASYEKMHVHLYSVQRLPQQHLCLHTLIWSHGLIISIMPTIILLTSTHNPVFKYTLIKSVCTYSQNAYILLYLKCKKSLSIWKEKFICSKKCKYL